MEVRSPGGELREVLPDALGVRMKDVGPVPVHEDAALVQLVEGVSGNMVSHVDYENTLVQLCCDALGEYRTGVSGSDDQPVKCHVRSYFLRGRHALVPAGRGAQTRLVLPLVAGSAGGAAGALKDLLAGGLRRHTEPHRIVREAERGVGAG